MRFFCNARVGLWVNVLNIGAGFEIIVTDFVTRFFKFYGLNFIQGLRNVFCLVKRSVHEKSQVELKQNICYFWGNTFVYLLFEH